MRITVLGMARGSDVGRGLLRDFRGLGVRASDASAFRLACRADCLALLGRERVGTSVPGSLSLGSVAASFVSFVACLARTRLRLLGGREGAGVASGSGADFLDVCAG